MSGRNSVPVIDNFFASISKREEGRLARIAAQLLADEPALNSIDVFGPGVRAGLAEGPALLIGDHREIALATPRGTELHEYRISHLAAEGDMLLINGGRNIAFERYREHVLGLGTIDAITLPASGRDGLKPLALRCLDREEPFAHITAKARKAGELTILPHIGRGSVWRLAGAIAKQAGIPVRVAAAPARLARQVNDKVWFARLVAEVLGARAQPSFHSVYGPAALTAYVVQLAKQAERIVIKVPDSAGSAGNISLNSDDLKDYSPKGLRTYLLSILADLGWCGSYPLLVEVWDSPVLANPSIQVWIPDRQDGLPSLEGIFEQIISGPEGEFVGSVPATLSSRWTEVVTEEAMRLAILFQKLGYFGRCSFDAVLAGQDRDNAVLHWIECNGRWGGVSIPMTLANRLTGDWSRQAFVVIQLTNLDFEQRTFTETLELLDTRVYQPGIRDEGIVPISPLGVELGRAINLMAIAGTRARAQLLAQQAIRLITGQSL